MSSYILYEPNHAFRVFIDALDLQFQNSDPRGKMVQNINFSLVSQNNDSSLKLNSTHQHESRGTLGFQNRVLNVKILKFHANRDKNAYLEKKLICNGSSFANFETPIRFMHQNEPGSGLKS